MIHILKSIINLIFLRFKPSIITWILWIMFNFLCPTYIFALILIIILPNITTIFWGLVLLFTGPPLGLIALFYAGIYGLIFWIVSFSFSILIDKLPYFYLKVFALIIILFLLLKTTNLPIYGSGSAFGDGSFPGKTLWQWYKIPGF